MKPIQANVEEATQRPLSDARQSGGTPHGRGTSNQGRRTCGSRDTNGRDRLPGDLAPTPKQLQIPECRVHKHGLHAVRTSRTFPEPITVGVLAATGRIARENGLEPSTKLWSSSLARLKLSYSPEISSSSRHTKEVATADCRTQPCDQCVNELQTLPAFLKQYEPSRCKNMKYGGAGGQTRCSTTCSLTVRPRRQSNDCRDSRSRRSHGATGYLA